MIVPYVYELWNGKEVVGYHTSYTQLHGKTMEIFELSMLHHPYGRRPKTLKLNLIQREVSNDGIDSHYRVVLDVRRKSKRQIALLNDRTGGLF